MTELRIADDLALPIDAVTQPIAILARRGAGKTYTASVFVEEVIRAKVPVVVLDPTGAWWGLRSSVDGEEPGLPVVIFGGDHGDVQLEPAAGKAIADVVIEHPGAYVVDLSGFESKAAEVRFAADFLERLYRAKKRETGPLLLVVDEADVFAPQQPRDKGDQIRTLGALEAIVRRGRIKGLGDLLISQRAAVINKNCLTQTEILIVMQTTGPQDRAAIDDWIKGNGTLEERAAVMDSLASLERGEAWVWSPSFLRILQRIRIRARTTFDSSRTPEAGEVAVAPRAFAAVDLEQLGARIAATIEQQKANDPAALKKLIQDNAVKAARRIAELEAQVREQPTVEVRIERVEVPVLNGQVTDLRETLQMFAPAIEELHLVADAIGVAATSIVTAIDRVAATPRSAPVIPAAPLLGVGREPDLGRIGAPPAKAGIAGVSPASLGRAERLILAALATYSDRTRTQTQVAILTGYSGNGGGFRNALGRLRSLAYVEGGRSDLRITEAGLAAAGDIEPLPRGRALLDHWLGQLAKAERLALEVLADAFPLSLTQEELGARAGYEPTGGGFRNALGKLRTLELINGGREAIRASADLVEA